MLEGPSRVRGPGWEGVGEGPPTRGGGPAAPPRERYGEGPAVEADTVLDRTAPGRGAAGCPSDVSGVKSDQALRAGVAADRLIVVGRVVTGEEFARRVSALAPRWCWSTAATGCLPGEDATPPRCWSSVPPMAGWTDVRSRDTERQWTNAHGVVVTLADGPDWRRSHCPDSQSGQYRTTAGPGLATGRRAAQRYATSRWTTGPERAVASIYADATARRAGVASGGRHCRAQAMWNTTPRRRCLAARHAVVSSTCSPRGDRNSV